MNLPLLQREPLAIMTNSIPVFRSNAVLSQNPIHLPSTEIPGSSEVCFQPCFYQNLHHRSLPAGCLLLIP